MRILGIDEIPEEWKGLLNPTGLARYGLFIEDLYQTTLVSEASLKRAIDILNGVRGQNFPYKNLKIGKPTISHLKKLNRAGHMGVLIQNKKGSAIQFLEGTLDNTLMPIKWRDADFLNITI